MANSHDSIEPVAIGWMRRDGTLHRGCPPIGEPDGWTPLYAAPPQRQPLTEEEIGLLTTGDGWSHCDTHALALFARAIERAHGIGNKDV